MNVDEERAAVEEADRLGDLLCPGFKPSEIFKHEMIASARDHFDRGHTSDCAQAHMWEMMTKNRFFAMLIRDYVHRNKLVEGLSELPEEVFEEDLGPGTAAWLFTGLIPNEKQGFRDLGGGFAAFAVMRVHDIITEETECNGEQLMQHAMWEGFLAGMMFAQSTQVLDARPE